MGSWTRTFALVAVGLLGSACSGGGSDDGGGGGTGWTIAAVKTGVGARSVALALDSARAPHVAFIDAITGQVFYGSRDGGAWTAAAVPGTTCADEEIALALDAQDRPHLAYQCDNGISPGGIRYAHRDGTGWHVEVVESAVVGARNPSLSLALTSAGAPAVTFYAGDGVSGGLRYAARSGGTWSTTTPVSTRYAGFHGTSLVFDPQDRPVLSYFTYDYASANQALRLARSDGATWSVEVVDSGPGVGEWSTLALDASGRPHLVYVDTEGGAVKYATKATAWTVETVGAGYLASLALAADGTPWVAWCVSAGSWVKVAPRAGGTWPADTLPATSADWTLDLAVDAAGARHLAYDSGSDAAPTYATRP